ncbi:UV radiation resistance protein [Rhizophagus clarus]|uniref:Autophagy-related protein 14 n=1 Tax=Rhizophagus clarus TaxID=94130 RepID=A0A8H3LXX9_9GLOM|nr:UV radiation resistance protein [Rhizophagus clarus]
MVVGQQSKQYRAPSPQMAKRSYTYDALMRLNNIDNCLVDMQRSRDDVISNIGQILEREKSKLVLKREKSSRLLHLSRCQDEITDQSKALEEDRRRIITLRESIRSRRTALEEAKERYQTGNEYLEESQKILERDRKSLFLTTSKLCTCQKELVADLLNIFPIEPTHTETFSFKILGVPLPNSVFIGCDDDQVATALGFACHLINMLAYYLGVPLRFPMIPMSSKSTICDPITASLGDSRQGYNTEYVTCRVPFKKLLNWIILSIVQLEGLFTNNQLGALFPLYAKGTDRYRFEYAVFLLNKNIEQLMNSQGQSSASHQRKLTSNNYTIPHNINNTIEEEEGENSHSHSKSSNTSNKNTKSHRKASQGFKVGVI